MASNLTSTLTSPFVAAAESFIPWGSNFQITRSGRPAAKGRTRSGNIAYFEFGSGVIGSGVNGMVVPVKQYNSETLTHYQDVVAKSNLHHAVQEGLKNEWKFAKALYETQLHHVPYLSLPSAIVDEENFDNPSYNDRISCIMPRNIADLGQLYNKLNSKQKQIAMHDIYQGTKFLMQNNCYHNDTKLDNVMLGSDGYFKYIDFGLLTCSASKDIGIRDYNGIYFKGRERSQAEEFANNLLQHPANNTLGPYHNSPCFLLGLFAQKNGDMDFVQKIDSIYKLERKLAMFHALKFLHGQLPDNPSAEAIEANQEFGEQSDYTLERNMESYAQEIKQRFLGLEEQFPFLKRIAASERTALSKQFMMTRTLSGNVTHIEKGEYLDKGSFGAVSKAKRYASQALTDSKKVAYKENIEDENLRSEAEFAQLLYQKRLHHHPYICCPEAIIDPDTEQPSLVMPRNIIMLEDTAHEHYDKALYDVYQGTKLLLQNNLYHNDLREDNIMLGSDGYFKHIDFGLATHSDADNIGLKDYDHIPFCEEGKLIDGKKEVAKHILEYLNNHQSNYDDNPAYILSGLTNNNDLKKRLLEISNLERKLAIFHAAKYFDQDNLPFNLVGKVAAACREFFAYPTAERQNEAMVSYAKEIKEQFFDLENEFPCLKNCPTPEQRQLLVSAHAAYISESESESDINDNNQSNDANPEQQYNTLKRKRESNTE